MDYLKDNLPSKNNKLTAFLDKYKDYGIYLLPLIVFLIGGIICFVRFANSDETAYLKETMVMSEYLRHGLWFGNAEVGSHGFLFKLPVALIYLITGPSIFVATLFNILIAGIVSLLMYRLSYKILGSRKFSFVATLMLIFSYPFFFNIATYLRDVPALLVLLLLILSILNKKSPWFLGLLLLLLLDAKEYIFFIVTPPLALWILLDLLRKYNLLNYKLYTNIIYRAFAIFLPPLFYITLMFTTTLVPVNEFVAQILQLNAHEADQSMLANLGMTPEQNIRQSNVGEKYNKVNLIKTPHERPALKEPRTLSLSTKPKTAKKVASAQPQKTIGKPATNNDKSKVTDNTKNIAQNANTNATPASPVKKQDNQAATPQTAISKNTASAVKDTALVLKDTTPIVATKLSKDSIKKDTLVSQKKVPNGKIVKSDTSTAVVKSGSDTLTKQKPAKEKLKVQAVDSSKIDSLRITTLSTDSSKTKKIDTVDSSIKKPIEPKDNAPKTNETKTIAKDVTAPQPKKNKTATEPVAKKAIAKKAKTPEIAKEPGKSVVVNQVTVDTSHGGETRIAIDTTGIEEDNNAVQKSKSDQPSKLVGKMQSIVILLSNIVIATTQKLVYPRVFSYLSFPHFIVVPAVIMAFLIFPVWKENKPEYMFLVLFLLFYLFIYMIRASINRYLLHSFPVMIPLFVMMVQKSLNDRKILRNALIVSLPLAITGLFFEKSQVAIKILITSIFYCLLFLPTIPAVFNNIKLKRRIVAAFFAIFLCFMIGTNITAEMTIGQTSGFRQFGFNGEYKKIAGYFVPGQKCWFNGDINLLQFYLRDTATSIQPWKRSKFKLKSWVPRSQQMNFGMPTYMFYTKEFESEKAVRKFDLYRIAVLNSTPHDLRISDTQHDVDVVPDTLPNWLKSDVNITLKNKTLKIFNVKNSRDN